jgi:hypothetical protein
MMRDLSQLIALSLVLSLPSAVAAAAEPAGQDRGAVVHIDVTPRGAMAETGRFRAEIRDGVLVSFFNKLTREEYLARDARPELLLPHLPSGLGTQHAAAEREAARKLFEWPWWDLPPTTTWPNQHYPTTTSTFVFETRDKTNVLLTYKGLSNGSVACADESFSLEVKIDAESGDLLLTPQAESPRGGVYGCGCTLTALAPEVTVEAPIFEGMRLDRHMQPALWTNLWANFWDYAFLALNGEKSGAVGLWCQDAELKTCKTLFYMVDRQGLSLSVQAMNLPPFDGLKSARPMTWRLQAFDKSWAQAAARFRQWRLKNVKIAPRPDWVQKLSFMEYGMDKASPTYETMMLEKYFGGKDLDRVLTWAPAVRGAGFDRNHANNDPYPGFRQDMQGWKAKHLKLMVYLQPMIMWGPDPKTERERQAVRFSALADTRSPFRADRDTVDLRHDQHNLGCPQWQRWFLDWVKEYIQGYGADGIYHDQSYCCPIDVRGASTPGGMTSTQGMADYFYKAATENPGSIHGTEHMTEVNNVGASLGLGCGIIWGTPGYQGHIGPPGSMNRQRIKQASPVSNALHSPNGAIFGFPHQSNYSEYGAVRFHQGMDQMERRGDLPAIPLGCYGFFLNGVPYDQCANEVWLDRRRATVFVHHGLRPDFPEDWKRNVLSYFKGAGGEDFRYEQMPWGTAFVQYSAGQRKLQYGRINGVSRAAVEGAILGWPCYDEHGPAGLNPDESATYVVEPAGQRPPAWFAPAADDVYVADGFANEDLAYFQLQPVPGRTAATQAVCLNAPVAPAAVYVDGKAIRPAPAGVNRWTIPTGREAMVVVLFREPAAGFAAVAGNKVLCRDIDPVTRRDILRPSFLADTVSQTKDGLRIEPAQRKTPQLKGESQVHVPLKAPADGVLRISSAESPPPACRWNGKTAAFHPTSDAKGHATRLLEVRMRAGEAALLSLTPTVPGTFAFEWRPDK